MTWTKGIAFTASMLISAFAVADISKPESAANLLASHLDTRGGQDALETLSVVERSGTIAFHEIGPDASGTYRTCIRYPNEVAIEIEAGPIQYHHVLNRHGALICEKGFINCKPAGSEYEQELRDTAKHANREELSWKIPEKHSMEELRDHENVISLSYVENEVRVELLFDTKSGLLKSHSRNNRTRAFSDWRRSGAILMPYAYDDYANGAKTSSVRLQQVVVSDALAQWCSKVLSVSD